MSYDVSLFRRDFLKRALESNLGDWTGADPIPEPVIDSLISVAERESFVRAPVDDAFMAFSRQEGFEPGVEFMIDSPTLLAQLTVFPGQVCFSIPYGPRADASIDFCVHLAKRMAVEHNLGFHDPQEDEALYE
jgi:hypothetical protein